MQRSFLKKKKKDLQENSEASPQASKGLHRLLTSAEPPPIFRLTLATVALR